jgi:tRNA 5-methylaminomethyl-2-thiouridine biosynthesis bifunctional protein
MDAALAWAGVRCTVPDRLPMVGFLAPESWPGLMVCAGMGARGLTLSVLCGEVLAAQYFGEPWPLERKLACALLAHRFAAKRV